MAEIITYYGDTIGSQAEWIISDAVTGLTIDIPHLTPQEYAEITEYITVPTNDGWNNTLTGILKRDGIIEEKKDCAAYAVTRLNPDSIAAKVQGIIDTIKVERIDHGHAISDPITITHKGTPRVLNPQEAYRLAEEANMAIDPFLDIFTYSKIDALSISVGGTVSFGWAKPGESDIDLEVVVGNAPDVKRLGDILQLPSVDKHIKTLLDGQTSDDFQQIDIFIHLTRQQVVKMAEEIGIDSVEGLKREGAVRKVRILI